MGAVAFGLCALWLSAELEIRWRCFAGGFFASLALLYRVDIAPALLASVLPLALTMKPAARWRWLSGAAIGILPLGLLAFAVGVQPMIENLFVVPVLYSSPARRLPISSVENYIICLFFAHLIASVANVTAGVIAVRRRLRDVNACVLLGWALFGLALTHQALQRLDFVHVLYPAFVSIGLLPVSLLTISANVGARLPGRSSAWLAALSVFAALAIAVPEISTQFRDDFASIFAPARGQGFFLEHNGRSFPLLSIESARVAGRLVDELDRRSKPGERLFVGPADLRRTNYNDTFIYHLVPKLRPATYFLEMNPFSANRPGSRLAADVASADWVVLNRRWDLWKEPNRSGEYGPDIPNDIVRQRFTLLGEYGSFLLFRKR